MTGNLYLDLLISLGGVAVLVLVSFLLGGWKSAKLDEAAARDRLAFDEPDFRPSEWLFGGDGKSAAALSEDGAEAAFVFALGDGLATRRAALGAVPVKVDGDKVVASLHDPSKWALTLAAGSPEEAARWAGRLSGAGYIAPHGNDVP